jgi:hypothetical protein
MITIYKAPLFCFLYLGNLYKNFDKFLFLNPLFSDDIKKAVWTNLRLIKKTAVAK